MWNGSDYEFPKQQLVTEQFRRETNEGGDSFFRHPSLRHLVFEPGERLIKFEQAGGSSASGQSEQRSKAWYGFEEIHSLRSKARPTKERSKRRWPSRHLCQGAGAATRESAARDPVAR
jgi:hypothetical protein